MAYAQVPAVQAIEEGRCTVHHQSAHQSVAATLEPKLDVTIKQRLDATVLACAAAGQPARPVVIKQGTHEARQRHDGQVFVTNLVFLVLLYLIGPFEQTAPT